MSSSKQASTTAIINEKAPRGMADPKVPGLIRLHPWGAAVPDYVPLPGLCKVGREEDNDLVLAEDSVSRWHAVVRPKGGGLEVTDQESRNGTYIDGTAVQGVASLGPGQHLRFGRCSFLVVDAVAKYSEWWVTGLKGPLVGGPTMGEVRQLTSLFGPMANAVLITGESGTGKEVVARAIHEQSGRGGRLVAVNCAAVPETMFEEQLFGHKKGAFTGATGDEPGFLRAAEGGTVFLDEIGELAQPSQAKLLRALEAKEVVPLGASMPIKTNVRVVAATNRDLAQAVEDGQFRSDLYSRLKVLTIPLVPLRKRPEDVALLSCYFCRSLPVPELNYESMETLCRYPWPGNARELYNVLVEGSARALAAGNTVIGKEHLRDEIGRKAAQVEPQGDDDRARAVLSAMTRHFGNVSKVASELKLHRQQVYNILYRFGRKPEDFRS